MSFSTQLLLGAALILVGAVLALGYPDAELLIFDGRPLGVVLAVVGVVDVVEALWRRGTAGRAE